MSLGAKIGIIGIGVLALIAGALYYIFVYARNGVKEVVTPGINRDAAIATNAVRADTGAPIAIDPDGTARYGGLIQPIDSWGMTMPLHKDEEPGTILMVSTGTMLAGGAQNMASLPAKTGNPVYTVDTPDGSITIVNIDNSFIPIPEANNTAKLSTAIMQEQIDTLKAVWTAAPFVAPVGRSITEAQLRAGDLREGDIMTVTSSQYGAINPSYLWYNAPIDAPMQYANGGWYLALPYNSASSTPALEYAAKNWINSIRASPAYLAQIAESRRLVAENAMM